MTPGRLQDTWYGAQPPGLLLRGLERVYRRLAAWDRARQLAARPPQLLGRPIVVVGNLTVGGTGKTPLVIRLCELLLESGLRPGVISRGYGRRGRGPVSVTVSSNPAIAGDEPLMIARRCAVPVRVDRDREAAAQFLLEREVQVVIADDGLQRLRLPRALELCVVDAQRGFGNGHLFPAGPLRELPARLDSVDWVVANGADGAHVLPPDAVPMTLRPRMFKRLQGSGTCSLEAMAARLAHAPGHAVAGIGQPQRFFDLLRSLGCAVQHELAFADHHPFTRHDFATLKGTVLMTEKDAVKCARLDLDDAWYLAVDTVLPQVFEEDFVARVRRLLGVQW